MQELTFYKSTNYVKRDRFCKSESCISGVKNQRVWLGKESNRNPLCRVATLPHSFEENDSMKTQIHSRSFKKVCLKRLRSVRLSGGVICNL